MAKLFLAKLKNGKEFSAALTCRNERYELTPHQSGISQAAEKILIAIRPMSDLAVWGLTRELTRRRPGLFADD